MVVGWYKLTFVVLQCNQFMGEEMYWMDEMKAA